ncbi:serine/threonine-protein kinase [Actinomadura decatromicini]|uniref:serine/threonine-protein kinase n=1 Tax=Actinomadura decatromicini TaxID=2604572 RepID=UPI001FEA3005|nr:serine/threonine-protein kinase [Actinomadura decatromicini]
MTAERVVIDGRFELRGRLGSGGMGTVWRAFDLALEREVALKEVRLADAEPSHQDPGVAAMMRERVMREARALARLDHPNVVTIHHIVDSPDMPHPWLVMELVRGRSLQDRLGSGPLTPGEGAVVGRGVLAALRAAHEAGICHRDVKPANVLMRTDGTPVLTDFGIAVLEEASRVTATGGLVGSPEYIAPERLHGTEGDPASDLWSLGLLLYVAVEGHNPLRRPTAAATLAAVMTAAIPPPQRAGQLAPVLQALLVREPAARPAAAQLDQMFAQAADAVTTAPGLAFPPPPAFPTPPPAFPTPPPGPGTHPNPLHTPASPPHTTTGSMQRPRRNGARWLVGIAAGIAVSAVVALIATLVIVVPKIMDATRGAAAAGPGARTGAAPTTTARGSGGGGTRVATLLTPAAIRAVIKKFETASGSTKFAEFSVYPDRASADAPVAGRRSAFDNYTYEKGADAAVRSRPSVAITTGDAKVDLKTFNWEALPSLLTRAARTLKVPKPTNRYIIVRAAWTFNGNAPTMLVYLTDDYGGGYLAVNLKGKVISTVPANS